MTLWHLWRKIFIYDLFFTFPHSGLNVWVIHAVNSCCEGVNRYIVTFFSDCSIRCSVHLAFQTLCWTCVIRFFSQIHAATCCLCCYNIMCPPSTSPSPVESMFPWQEVIPCCRLLRLNCDSTWFSSIHIQSLNSFDYIDMHLFMCFTGTEMFTHRRKWFLWNMILHKNK